MLEIETVADELYYPSLNKFVDIPATKLTLEHSLISISKWESKWHQPYMSDTAKTRDQELDYIRCMVIGKLPTYPVLNALTEDNILTIKEYIDNPMTATTFSKKDRTNLKKEIITAEVIYQRMFANNIPMECQKWHLNRLLTLIKVCNLQNAPAQKMNKKQSAAWAAEQNALRRAKYNTRG